MDKLGNNYREGYPDIMPVSFILISRMHYRGEFLNYLYTQFHISLFIYGKNLNTILKY